MPRPSWAWLAITLVALAGEVAGPAHGRGAQSVERDPEACRGWAAERSAGEIQSALEGELAFLRELAARLSALSGRPAPQPSASAAGRPAVRGAVRGAAVAEATGGEADKGAALGAVGARRRARRRADAQEERAEARAEQLEQEQALLSELQQRTADRTRVVEDLLRELGAARAACLEGSGDSLR